MREVSPRLKQLLTRVESESPISGDLRAELLGLSDEDLEALIDIAKDGVPPQTALGNQPLTYMNYPLGMQLAAICALAETGSGRALEYLSRVLEFDEVQLQEAYDPGDMYNMGGRSGGEEYFPEIRASLPNVRGKLLVELCTAHWSNPYTNYYTTRDTFCTYEITDHEILKVVTQAKQRINETIAGRQSTL